MDSKEAQKIKAQIEAAINERPALMRNFQELKARVIDSGHLSYYPAVELKSDYIKAWNKIQLLEKKILRLEKKLLKA